MWTVVGNSARAVYQKVAVKFDGVVLAAKIKEEVKCEVPGFVVPHLAVILVGVLAFKAAGPDGPVAVLFYGVIIEHLRNN